MGLLDRITSVVIATGTPGWAAWIPPEGIRPAPDPAPPPFAADATYLRWFLAEARLEHSRTWFTDWHPAIHAAVARQFGDTVDEHVSVLSPGSVPGLTDAAAAAVTVDKPLTPLLPFGGGSVSVNVGLVAVKGDNAVRTLIDVIGSFGGVVTSAALTTGLDVAGKVVDGFEKLLGLGPQRLALAYETTLAAAGGGAPTPLAPGYLVVLDHTPPPDAQMCVDQGRLAVWHQGRRVVPPGGHLLLRLECRAERDDWLHLDGIWEPVRAARQETDSQTRRSHYQRALVAARTSRALHEADRIRIAIVIRDERDTDVGLGAVESLPGSVAELAASSTLSIAEALERRPGLPELLV